MSFNSKECNPHFIQGSEGAFERLDLCLGKCDHAVHQGLELANLLHLSWTQHTREGNVASLNRVAEALATRNHKHTHTGTDIRRC